MRSTALALATAAILTFVPATASAAVMGFNGTRYSYAGAAGETNDLRVEYYPGPGEIRFDDAHQILDDGTLPATCDYVAGDVTYVKCPLAPNPRIDLGDGNDSVQGDISSDGGPEEIYAGSGDDVLRGGHGHDLLDGGDGDDDFEKGSSDVRGGSDTIVGAGGFDETYYRGDFAGAGTEPVMVILDGASNDGPAGQADNVQTEAVYGSERNDILIGGPDPETLDGDDGDDNIRGGDGNDQLDGNLGNDSVLGEDGDDTLRDSSATNDHLDGGAGRDDITADGPCFFIGCNPGGNDEVLARDGVQDTIRCLGGADTAIVDAIDTLLPDRGGCEAVDLPVMCVVPNLKGLTLSSAKRRLKAAHCKLGKVKKPKAKRGRKKPKLVVKSHSPKRGATLPENARVNVTLGPKKKRK